MRSVSRMLMQFLYGFPLFFFLTFGLFHLSELAFSLGAAEQAAFFSARSEMVGMAGERSVREISASAFVPLEGKTRKPRVEVSSAEVRAEMPIPERDVK